ncbi:unnamed protein product [Ixodes persulcatus]
MRGLTGCAMKPDKPSTKRRPERPADFRMQLSIEAPSVLPPLPPEQDGRSARRQGSRPEPRPDSRLGLKGPRRGRLSAGRRTPGPNCRRWVRPSSAHAGRMNRPWASPRRSAACPRDGVP